MSDKGYIRSNPDPAAAQAAYRAAEARARAADRAFRAARRSPWRIPFKGRDITEEPTAYVSRFTIRTWCDTCHDNVGARLTQRIEIGEGDDFTSATTGICLVCGEEVYQIDGY